VANEMKIATRLRVELVQKEFVPYFWIGTQWEDLLSLSTAFCIQRNGVAWSVRKRLDEAHPLGFSHLISWKGHGRDLNILACLSAIVWILNVPKGHVLKAWSLASCYWDVAKPFTDGT
jgi:hypothetical protein